MNTTKSYNLSYLEEISGGDKEFVNEMITEFLKEAPVVTLSIETYFKQEKWSELYAAVHRFAPNYDFVGNQDLKLNISLLESASKHMRDLEKIDLYIVHIKKLTAQIIEELKTDFKL